MADKQQTPNPPHSVDPIEIEVPIEVETNNTGKSYSGKKPHYPNPPEIPNQCSGQKPHYPNPPDASIPDPVTLREQWKFATRQYSRWYSQAWGTAILAGAAFFALGWVIKGSNPLPSKQDHDGKSSSGEGDRKRIG